MRYRVAHRLAAQRSALTQVLGLLGEVMADWQIHEKRSQELADSVRRYLVAAHTGGIATIFAVAGSLATNGVHPKWAIAPVLAFALGLVLAGISMLLAQHREMKRRDAMKAEEPNPEFGHFWWSWTWNWASLLTFVVAILVGLCALGNISIAAR